MPRITVTDEELKKLEEWRVKNAETLGFNAGIEQVAILMETGAIAPALGNLTDADYGAATRSMANAMRHYKRELK